VLASRYTRVSIGAWQARSAAGDALATWQAVAARRCVLSHDSSWGWVGRCGADQDALAVAVTRGLTLPSGLLAVGLGTSKGALAQHTAGDGPDWMSAFPGATSMTLARHLGLGLHLPCACAAACSTGLACLLAGADLVERGQADGALVGASEASLTPLILAGFRNAGVLCGTTPPQAFGSPTGFAPAEGAAAFTLGPAGPWRLVAGIRLGDAGHETQFTDSRTLATALASLWSALPDPDLIACHATGTAAGDAYERAGLDAGPWRDIPRWCAKPWIGHALGASGAVELAAVLHAPVRRIWKLSLGFGGHLVAVAVERQGPATRGA
jgi:3-oxoacyl-(acyl-carrier-protein) synthase